MIYSFIMICSYDLLILINFNFYYDLFSFLTQGSRRANYFCYQKTVKKIKESYKLWVDNKLYGLASKIYK